MRPVQAAIIATVALCSADSAQRSSSTGIAPVGCSYMWRPSSSWCKPCEAVPLRLRGGGKGGRAEAGRCGQGMTVTTFESDASNTSGAEEMQTVTNAGWVARPTLRRIGSTSIAPSGPRVSIVDAG